MLDDMWIVRTYKVKGPWGMGHVTDGTYPELWVVEESEDASLMEALFALAQQLH
jgi:hypothetical protein